MKFILIQKQKIKEKVTSQVKTKKDKKEKL